MVREIKKCEPRVQKPHKQVWYKFECSRCNISFEANMENIELSFNKDRFKHIMWNHKCPKCGDLCSNGRRIRQKSGLRNWADSIWDGLSQLFIDDFIDEGIS
jgi:ribosomal protein L44E